MEIIRKFFISLDLKSLQSVGLLHENHIVIFISQEEDYTRLLMRTIWYIAGAPMKVLKWSPEFYPNVESPVVPVWIGLPGLPLHFFEKSALFHIASAFGTPLKIDEPTVNLTKPTVARVCIEVDVSKPRKHRLWVGDEKVGFWQDVIYENPPLYCDFCKMLGHEVSGCFKKNPSLKTETQKAPNSQDARTVGASQKTKEVENRNETRKEKEVLHSLAGKHNGNEWVIVGKKHKLKAASAQAVTVSVLPVSEKDLSKEYGKPNERTSEQRKACDSLISVIPEKDHQKAVVGKPGDRPIAVLATVPPLLRQHLSTAGIALTPFPDLVKIKQGKGIKDGTGEPSDSFFMKNTDSTGVVPITSSVEEYQKPPSRLNLHEMGKNLQAMSFPSLSCTNKPQSLDATQVPSQPLILNVREEQTKIQPHDQVPIKIRPSDALDMNSNPHPPSKPSVNKGTGGSVLLVEDNASAAESEKTVAILSVNPIISQPFDEIRRNGPDALTTAVRPELDSEAGGSEWREASLGSHSQQPLDQRNFKDLDSSTAPLQSAADNTRVEGPHAAMAEIRTEKAAISQLKQIQPLDRSIETQPSDSASRKSGPNTDGGLSELGLPNVHSAGLNSGRGLDQAGLEEGNVTNQLGSPQPAEEGLDQKLGLNDQGPTELNPAASP